MATPLQTLSPFAILSEQKSFFASGKTHDLSFRLEQLKILAEALIAHQEKIVAALYADLHKPAFEAYGAEILPVLDEINVMRSNLAEWARPQKLTSFADVFDPQGEAYSIYEPLGVALIIAPWNYPVQLLLNPLVGSMGAGNCSVLKPSRSAPATAQAIANMLDESFDAGYIRLVSGEVARALIDEPFDYIFFTGSVPVGKKVMKAAAEHLAPVTLELGGKSPCIVARDADLENAAKRIVWGKFFNTGQTCVAPDYLLVDSEIKQALVARLAATLRDFFGDDPSQSQGLGRIVNQSQFDRLVGYLDDGKIAAGGQHDRQELYIAPTILLDVAWDAPVMTAEIFGPILPVLEFGKLDEAIQAINQRPKPLALYVFSESQPVQEELFQNISFGGGCLNDTISHEPFAHIPFGGVGQSGMGAYHGRESFNTFSHKKSLLKRSPDYDATLRFPPYGQMQLKVLKGMVATAGEEAARDIQVSAEMHPAPVEGAPAPGADTVRVEKLAPAITLTAVGSGRQVDLSAPGKRTLLLLHTQSTIQAASQANQAIRERYPVASQLVVANLVDLHAIPTFLRGMVDRVLLKTFKEQEADLGRLTNDFVVILPDWDGAVARAFGLRKLGKWVGVVVLNDSGGIEGTYQGNDPTQGALELLGKQG